MLHSRDNATLGKLWEWTGIGTGREAGQARGRGWCSRGRGGQRKPGFAVEVGWAFNAKVVLRWHKVCVPAIT
jgi:hypothetical protein